MTKKQVFLSFILFGTSLSFILPISSSSTMALAGEKLPKADPIKIAALKKNMDLLVKAFDNITKKQNEFTQEEATKYLDAAAYTLNRIKGTKEFEQNFKQFLEIAVPLSSYYPGGDFPQKGTENYTTLLSTAENAVLEESPASVEYALSSDLSPAASADETDKTVEELLKQAQDHILNRPATAARAVEEAASLVNNSGSYEKAQNLVNALLDSKLLDDLNNQKSMPNLDKLLKTTLDKSNELLKATLDNSHIMPESE